MSYLKNQNYSPVPAWCKLPYGMTFKNDATSVSVDSKDNVYVFCRGPIPVIIFNSDGEFLNSWGEGEFFRPHGIAHDKEDNVYLIELLRSIISSNYYNNLKFKIIEFIEYLNQN